MATSGQVTWNTSALEHHAREGVQNALGSASEFGHAYWDATAPVSDDRRTSGDLRRSWDAVVHQAGNGYVLTISANTRYAIYIELGVPSKNMLPRAPLRATAGEISAILPTYLRDELTP